MPSVEIEADARKDSLKRKSNLWFRLCIALLILAFFSLALTPAIIRYGLKQKLGPEKYAELRSFFDDPVSVPEEWREPKEFPADLVEAVSRDIVFRKNWKSSYSDIDTTLKKVWGDREFLTPQLAKESLPFFKELEPYFESFKKLVSHPEYGLAVWDTFGVSNFDTWYGLSSFPRRAGIYAQVLAASGEWGKAFNLILPSIQFAKGKPPHTIMSKMLAVVCVGIGVGNAQEVYEMCNDENALENFLTDLNSLEIFERIPDTLDLHLENAVVNLVVGDATGSIPLVKEKESIAFFNREAENLYMDSYYPYAESWQSKIQRSYPISNFIQVLAIDELQCSLYPGFDLKGVCVDLVRVRVKSDLLRLNIANRILELRGREKATRASELVPEFFEKELVHPDTGEVYEWDGEKGEFVFDEE